MKKTLRFLTLAVLSALLVGCSAVERTVYMQDVQHNATLEVAALQQIRIKPHDRLTVVVTSKDPELAAPFNATSSYNSLSGNPMGNSSYGAQSLQVRTVDENGMLYMPIIGNVYCEGKTRSELSADIAKKIVEGGFLNDPSVNIQFADMKVFVMGEVTRPGQFDITRDQITLLEALAMAGDLTIYGNRANVTVVRASGDKTMTYVVNLLDKKLFTSPAYYLQQGDVVYVQPNKYRAATSEINQNRTFWISIVSTLLTATSLAVSIIGYTKR